MKFSMLIKMALRALKRNRMRSTLIVLGIIIGVAAVIAMVSIGQGARDSVQSQIKSLGSNLIMVFNGTVSRGGASMGWGATQNLKEDDAQAIQAECPSVAAITPIVRTSGQVVAGDQNWSTSIQG